jgi:hypothetical protein
MQYLSCQEVWIPYPENKPSHHRVRFMDAGGNIYAGFYSKTEDNFYAHGKFGPIKNVSKFSLNSNRLNQYASI